MKKLTVEVNEMLNTEKNTAAMGKRVERAANAHFGHRGHQANFEHGQWWVTHLKSGRQYAVADAEGPRTTHGFDFEQVSEGDE